MGESIRRGGVKGLHRRVRVGHESPIAGADVGDHEDSPAEIVYAGDFGQTLSAETSDYVRVSCSCRRRYSRGDNHVVDWGIGRGICVGHLDAGCD